ncbi:CRAL-TRIO-N domain-containing protein [Mycena indigotica]|uniref:CRAL-TRIO-N domain-containing protein n=1 Tax=Mycena indigotica TaxID=2126181 RepID=A0A8H6T5Y4_9AGAR|nr:CRAL-TRIO-N domain-containing protein [Mycena indigotica]KAF7312388.1 CRAL-TRIO-N domain-containing protein [Mycena indigotica]
MPPIQEMLQGLYNTTLDFFDLRNLAVPGASDSELFARQQLDTTGNDRRLRASDPSPMRRGLETQLARSQAEVVKLQERCAALERALKGTREVLQAREAELDRLRKLECSSTSAWSGNGSIMLEEQQARSRSNDLFMTRTDNWSGSSIIQAVCDINSELIGFSSAAIELSTFESRTDASTQAMQETDTRLGPHIVKMLEAWPTGSDPTLVGLVLQAGVATCVARAVSAFALGLPAKAETTLSQVYSHIFFSEPQPTSARWRALTHRHVHTLYPGLAEYALEELKETIYRWAADILLAVGAESMSRQWIRDTFGQQITRIAKSVLAFAKLCKEGIMSTNFDIVIIESGQTFDERVMVDLFDPQSGEGDTSHPQGVVLATTELGLRRMTRRTVGDESGTVEHQVLLRPKVLLESVLSTSFVS